LKMRTILPLKAPGTTQPMALNIGDFISLFFDSISRNILVPNSELYDYKIRVLKSERN
jgi:hypothetical protein